MMSRLTCPRKVRVFISKIDNPQEVHSKEVGCHCLKCPECRKEWFNKKCGRISMGTQLFPRLWRAEIHKSQLRQFLYQCNKARAKYVYFKNYDTIIIWTTVSIWGGKLFEKAYVIAAMYADLYDIPLDGVDLTSRGRHQPVVFSRSWPRPLTIPIFKVVSKLNVGTEAALEGAIYCGAIVRPYTGGVTCGIIVELPIGIDGAQYVNAVRRAVVLRNSIYTRIQLNELRNSETDKIQLESG